MKQPEIERRLRAQRSRSLLNARSNFLRTADRLADSLRETLQAATAAAESLRALSCALQPPRTD